MIIHGDCVQVMGGLDSGTVDLVFADPPFNINYKYDQYQDNLSADEYLNWSRSWMKEVKRLLKLNGTFWLAIGDEYAAELKVLATRELGFVCRSWVVWYYTFGVNCTKKFTRSHTHLFHFVVNPNSYTFNADEVKVPSARQLVYNDKRAASGGRLPDDTWILRPQWCDGFQPDEDVWHFPRVCGTFKERQGWHGCQMPETLLERVLSVSTAPQDLVLDPFAGSGTTLVVAKRLDRRYVGIELSEDYVQRIKTRLEL